MKMIKRKIKRVCMHLPVIGGYIKFKRRYNEPRAVKFWRFIAFQIIPANYLHLFFKREEYLPVDRFSSDIRGNVFVGVCSRFQRQGCYLQGRGKLFIGDYVESASNVAIISGNHSVYNQEDADLRETIIGDYCWLASNVVVLAGVVLGPRTIVGAGSVVTKSFPEGYCVIGGNPAKVLKKLEPGKVVFERAETEYYGYLPIKKFRRYFDLYYKNLDFSYDVSKVSNNEFFNRYNK